MFSNPQEIDIVFVGSGNGVQAASISPKVSAISAVDRVAVSDTDNKVTDNKVWQQVFCNGSRPKPRTM